MPLFGAAILWIAALGLPVGVSAGEEHGKELYARHCALCHGADGRGETPAGRLLQPPPGNFADPIEASRRPFEDAYKAIKDGRPGTAMGAWGPVLGETEIGDLIDHIRTLSARDRSSAPSAERLSLEVGKRIYDRECVSCHGSDGKGQTGIAEHLRVRPTDFSDPLVMARLDDGRMFMAIFRGRPGTAMGGQGQLLSHAEVIDVMRYIRTLARPLPAGTTPAQLDLRVGELVYRRHCIACHGERGDGRTPLGGQLASGPFDLTQISRPGGPSEDDLAQAIVHGKPGTAMAPWDGVLNKDDVRRVLVFIRQTFAPR